MMLLLWIQRPVSAVVAVTNIYVTVYSIEEEQLLTFTSADLEVD